MNTYEYAQECIKQINDVHSINLYTKQNEVLVKWNAIWTEFKSFLVYMYIINYNPLCPTGTWDRISPYTISTTPSRQVMRIEGNIF